MKLNHDCIRELMIFLEENLDCENGIHINNIELKEFDKDDIIYSIMKLSEAKYIRSSDEVHQTITGDVTGSITAITWEGHKFLDTIRDNKVWKQTKGILSKLSSASISFTASVASQVITNLISQEMGLSPIV